VERKEFADLAKNFDKTFARLTTTERKQFVRTFIGRIEIFPSQYRVRYNYDERMVVKALNVLDLAAYQNSRGVGPSGPAPSVTFRKKDQGTSYSNVFSNGRKEAKLLEQPDAIKAYLVRWNGIKFDLTKLARLRWIENMKTPELCRVFGKGRTAVRQGIRTLRKCGISKLNLTNDEKNLIERQMKREEQIFGGMYT
jgi:hypothetical protein